MIDTVNRRNYAKVCPLCGDSGCAGAASHFRIREDFSENTAPIGTT